MPLKGNLSVNIRRQGYLGNVLWTDRSRLESCGTEPGTKHASRGYSYFTTAVLPREGQPWGTAGDIQGRAK